MSGFLLDTNVISELTKDAPDSRVMAFLNEQPDLWLAAVVIHELDFGIQLMPEGRRKEQLRTAQETVVNEYVDRILPLGQIEAEIAATLRAAARRAGKTVYADALIAGTAKAHNLIVATRNGRDFEDMEVGIVNPWLWESAANPAE